MEYRCQIERRELQATLVMRARLPVGKLPQFLGRAFAEVVGHLGMMGEAPAGPPFVAYHNQDMQDLEVEAGFPTAHEVPGTRDLVTSAIPGGEAATCVHVGPYDQMGPAYEALTRFIEAQGRKASGVAFEIYLNDPSTTEPGRLETQIVFPLV